MVKTESNLNLTELKPRKSGSYINFNIIFYLNPPNVFEEKYVFLCVHLMAFALTLSSNCAEFLHCYPGAFILILI